MTGDILDYLESNNKDAVVEDESGNPQRCTLIATPGGFKHTTEDPVPVKLIENQSPSIEHFLYEELNDVTILSVSPDGKTVTLAPGHGFLAPVGIDKDYLNVHYVDPLLPAFVGTRFSQHTVVDVTGDDIEITPPIAYTLDPVYVEFSRRVNVNMAVAGSRVAPVKFLTFPPDGQVWDIRRFIIDMILTSAGDDGLFGNLPALANGQYFGFESPVFSEYNLAIFDNGGYRASGYDVVYPPRSGGGGNYGMSTRKTLAGQEKSGVVLRVDGALDDSFVSYIQDILTGLVRYRIKVMGNILQ